MTTIYIFTSSRKSDAMSTVHISTISKDRAYALASKHFAKHGYKGVPVLAV